MSFIPTSPANFSNSNNKQYEAELARRCAETDPVSTVGRKRTA